MSANSQTEGNLSWCPGERVIPGRERRTTEPPASRDEGGAPSLAFAGLLAFTFLLFARPNEMFPEVFGTFPLIKIVGGATLLAYLFSRLTRGERLTIWPVEMVCMCLIAGLGVLFTPIAASPADSITVLTETYLKVLAIFCLMINLIDTRRRLRGLMKVAVVCGAVMALGAVADYAAGNLEHRGTRIAGLVGGVFGNANDLAMALDILLPLAVALALLNRGAARLGWLACAAALAAGVVATFSRGGFLGLVAVAGVLLWKLGRGRLEVTLLAGALFLGVFIAAMPAGYADRLTTIFDTTQDRTGSAQARRDLLERAVQVASNHLVFGVGMGNYHIYSLREQVAHNSPLEIAAELGVAGLIAYLIIIFAPLRSLRRVERDSMPERAETARLRPGPDPPPDDRERQDYVLSIGLQAAIIGYFVCNLFASVQYLWYLYYPAAFAVALRHMRLAEGGGETTVSEREKEGVLWEAFRAGRASR